MSTRVWGLIAICLFLLASSRPVSAEGWGAHLFAHPSGPELFLAIDKQSQKFHVMRQQSPLTAVETFPCTTGRETGDKLKEGDMRTPEGVYFVQGKLTDGLDYGLYGDLAFPLNFPNPVDRIRGKTGYGIWIHGRGHPITNRETQGCVAMNTPDIHKIEGTVRDSLPVIIAESVRWSQEDAQAVESERIAEEVRKWAGDWQNRSEDFFTHYDPADFSVAEGAPFQGFADHKRGIFQSQPWIQVMVGNIRVLPGPGYWVSCFDQFYRTRTLTSQVGKRLYWQKGPDGRFRIVGREFAETGADLEPAYLERAGREVKGFLDQWSGAWESANMDNYLAAYAPDAVQGSRHGRNAIENQKESLWKLRRPEKVRIDDTEVRLHPEGLAVRFVQTYQDSSGYRDMGFKHLVLAPQGDGWVILSEQWRELE